MSGGVERWDERGIKKDQGGVENQSEFWVETKKEYWVET